MNRSVVTAKLRAVGAAGFLFFLGKGLLWIVLGLAMSGIHRYTAP